MEVDRTQQHSPRDVSASAVQGVRARLLALRHATQRRSVSLTKSFDDIVSAANDVATDDEHDPEGHTIAWERQQLAALVLEANTSLAHIVAAEERLENGSYGRCSCCGCAIAADRLQALPTATSCIACAI